MGQAESTPSQAAPSSPKTLAAMVVLGAFNAMWAVFLWGQLLLARQGGETFCGVSGEGGCTALWDSGFASSIHSLTQVPVAGWGVIYGLAALLMPLLALVQKDRAFFTASKLLAAVGVLTVAVLLVVSAQQGQFCTGCAGTYALTLAYAIAGLWGLRANGFDDLPKAAMASGGVVLGAFLLMVYPGANTPKSQAQASRDAIKQSGQTAQKPVEQPTQPTQPTQPPPPADAGSQLKSFINSLPLELKQGLADSLYIYKTSPAVPQQPARSIIGDKNAPLLITDFTDARCGHCAQLHATLKEINNAVPAGSFKLEPRHFPLDGTCNKGVQRKSDDGVGCVAAGAQICLEGSDKAFDFSSKLFENGPKLTANMVYDLAAPYMAKDKLQACVQSPATQKKIQDDIAWAEAHHLEGTPLVLINGKKGTGFGPFVFAMILAQGNADHPAFAGLPQPNPNAHQH